LFLNFNSFLNHSNQKEIEKGLVKNFDVYKKQTIEDYIKYRIKNDKNIEEINNEVEDNALEEKLNKQKQEINNFFDVLNKTITDELFTLKKDNKEQTKEKIEEVYNIRKEIEKLNKLNKYKKEFNQNEYDIKTTKNNEKKKKLEKRNKHIQEIVVILLKKDPEKDDITKIFDEINTEKNNKDKKELSLKLREYEQLLNKQDEIDCLRHYNRQLEEEKDNIKLENKEIKKINEENEKLKKEQQDLNVKDVDGKVLNYGQPYNITADEQNFYNYCDTKYKETIKELKNNVSVNSTSKVYEKIDEKIGKEIIKNIKNKMKFLNNGEKKFNKEENKDLQIFLYQLFGALQNAKVKEYYTIEDFSRNSNDDKHYLETQYNNGVDIEFADIMELSQHVSRCATNCHTSFNDFSKMRKTKDKIDNTDNNILNCIDGNNYLYKEPYYMNKKHSFLTAEYHYKNVAKNNVLIAQNVIKNKNKNKKPVFIVPSLSFWAGNNFINIYSEVVFNYYQEIKNTFNDDFTIYFRDSILKGLNDKYINLYKALKKLINFKKNISTKYSEYEQKNIEEELKNKCKNIFDQIHKDTYIYISEKEQNSLDDKFNKIIQKYLNKDSFTLEDIQLDKSIKNPIDKQIMNLFKDNNKDNYKEEYINFLNQIDKKIIFVNHKESTKIPFNNDKQEVFLLFAGDFGTICGNDCLTAKRLTTSDEVIIMRTDYAVIMQPNEIRKQLFNKFIDAKEDSGINGAIYCLCKNDIDGKRILPPKEWWIGLDEIFYIDRFDKKRYNLGENWKDISKKIENKFNKNNNKNSKIDYLFIPKIIDNKEPINTNLNKEKQINI